MIRVLGTAQDGGVPQLGCSCCEDVKPRLVASLGLCLENGQTFLFDASPDIREQVRALPKRRNVCDGIFLTHLHVGHYIGLLQVGKEGACASNLPVYASAKVASFFRENEPFKSLVTDQRILLKTIAPGDKIALSEDVTVEVVAVKHRSEFSDTFSFLISGKSKALFYCPDADDWSWGVEKWIEASNVSLLDGTFFSRDELPNRDMKLIPHPLIRDSMSALEKFVGKVFFTHFNHTNAVLRNETLVTERGFHVLQEKQEFSLQ
jgi:pyrroloquinoline quinone biosynthesis protein B